MRAVGYVRVSTEEQARRGVSLAAQRDQVKAYCRARRWQLVKVHADEGLSGRSLDRPGLQAALADVREGRATALVVTKLDRLSRNTRHILALVEDDFASNGVALVSIAETLDTTTAMGKFVVTLLAGLAQMEREQIGERTRAALATVKARGRHLGQVRYGKRRDASGRLVDDRDEQNALRRARRLRKAGASWREIAEAMDWTVSQARTRLDPKYRAATRASFGKAKRK